MLIVWGSFNTKSTKHFLKLNPFDTFDTNFANLTGKDLCWSLFLIKLQASRQASLWKRDFNTGVFLWNVKQNTSGGCFWTRFGAESKCNALRTIIWQSTDFKALNSTLQNRTMYRWHSIRSYYYVLRVSTEVLLGA